MFLLGLRRHSLIPPFLKNTIYNREELIACLVWQWRTENLKKKHNETRNETKKRVKSADRKWTLWRVAAAFVYVFDDAISHAAFMRAYKKIYSFS